MLRFLMTTLVYLISMIYAHSVIGFTKGIYLTQSTAENSKRLVSLIHNAKKKGIDTFVIDIKRPSKRYIKAIKQVKMSGLKYVARVVIFPGGGTDSQVKNKNIWLKRLALMNYAINHGAKAIQLDYIRYRARTYPSKKKVNNIENVVKFFKKYLSKHNIDMQLDIFGVVAHHPSYTIGQDAKVLAKYTNVFCPMVYPSHYEPYQYHAKRPYKTVFDSIVALKKQLKNFPKVKIIAYIELYNYRYPLLRHKRYEYIKEQIRAVKKAGADGWYVWSARNKYHSLFTILKNN